MTWKESYRIHENIIIMGYYVVYFYMPIYASDNYYSRSRHYQPESPDSWNRNIMRHKGSHYFEASIFALHSCYCRRKTQKRNLIIVFTRAQLIFEYFYCLFWMKWDEGVNTFIPTATIKLTKVLCVAMCIASNCCTGWVVKSCCVSKQVKYQVILKANFREGHYACTYYLRLVNILICYNLWWWWPEVFIDGSRSRCMKNDRLRVPFAVNAGFAISMNEKRK